MLATVDKNPAGDKEDEEVLATVLHYTMDHYEEKGGIKKKNKTKSGQCQSEAGINWFGE